MYFCKMQNGLIICSYKFYKDCNIFYVLFQYELCISCFFFSHTNGKKFSTKGIQIVVDHFKLRGHVVKVFLPQHVRKKEHEYLEQLYKEGIVVFTPSRTIDGRKITSYDDRYT